MGTKEEKEPNEKKRKNNGSEMSECQKEKQGPTNEAIGQD